MSIDRDYFSLHIIIQRQSSLMTRKDQHGHLHPLSKTQSLSTETTLVSPSSSRDNQVRWHVGINMVVRTLSKYLYFFMWKNTNTWGHVTRLGTSLRLMLITMGKGEGMACAWLGDRDKLLASFPKWECHEDTLRLLPIEWYHIAFESWVRCMHHSKHNWFELLKNWWLVCYVYVELMENWE